MRKSVFKRLLSLVFVDKCALCKKPCQGALCKDCRDRLHALTSFCCERCGKPLGSCVCKKLSNSFERCISALKFEDAVVSALTYKLKHSGNENVAELLSLLLAEKIRKEYSDIKFDFVTYVPESFRDSRKKGFDHAHLIAKRLSDALSVSLVRPPIKRKGGKKQKYQDSQTRKKNASNKYIGRSRPCLFGTVLLVDDVMTTGNTLSVCADLLKAAGADRVYCATCATSVKNKIA